jgi:hypothetical protein
MVGVLLVLVCCLMLGLPLLFEAVLYTDEQQY